MPTARVGYAGSIALELHKLRTENDQLRPRARSADHLQRVVADQMREINELRDALRRSARRKRQPSGPRRRDAGDADRVVDRAHSDSGSAG